MPEHFGGTAAIGSTEPVYSLAGVLSLGNWNDGASVLGGLSASVNGDVIIVFGAIEFFLISPFPTIPVEVSAPCTEFPLLMCSGTGRATPKADKLYQHAMHNRWLSQPLLHNVLLEQLVQSWESGFHLSHPLHCFLSNHSVTLTRRDRQQSNSCQASLPHESRCLQLPLLQFHFLITSDFGESGRITPWGFKIVHRHCTTGGPRDHFSTTELFV
jgi:hypothetical protein